VFLRADGQLNVQDEIEVLDNLKAGGVQNVGIVTRLPGEQ
jgi:biopolymer transport protein ExbD